MTASSHRSWSLRRRLVVGIVALLTVLCAIVGAASVAALHGTLIARLDDQVRDAALRSTVPVPMGGPDHAGDQGEPGSRIGTLLLRVRDGAVLRAEYVGDDGEQIPLAADQIARLLALPLDDGELATVALDGLGEFRVTAREAPPAGDLVLTGLPTAEIAATTTSLALIFGGVTLAALVVAVLAGTQVVRLALQPLHRVTATARRVAELPLARGEVALAERVPDPDPLTEVGQMGAAINRMLEHVESSLVARQHSEERVRQFVADASHELRTPLASIRGYSELTRRTGSELPEDIAYALSRIESESVRMTALVEELLLLARLDAGQGLSLGPVDLSSLLADAVSDARAASPDHEWRLVAGDDPVLVRADADRIHQVLVNLLANARAHTPAGTVVTARLERAGDAAVVSVADDGPGIPAELRPTLFERFARGDGSRSRATGGAGLGLAIVAAVVAAHGGTVTAEDVPAGARLVVRLPLASGDR